MMTSLRLCYSYFTATAGARWTLLVGILATIACLLYPNWVLEHRLLQLAALFAWGATVASSMAMPKAVDRLIRGRLACTVPQGRLKAIVSAWLTTALVSLPAVLMARSVFLASAATAGGTGWSFWHAYSAVMWIASIVYLWVLLAPQIGKPGKLLRLAIFLGSAFTIPSTLLSLQKPSLRWHLPVLVACWVLLTLCACNWPRVRHFAMTIKNRLRESLANQRTRGVRIPIVRKEAIAMALGLGIGWIGFLMTAILLVLNLQLDQDGRRSVFLLYWSSMVGYVMTVDAAIVTQRSRTLWLRLSDSRDALFARLERLLWRRNGVKLMLFAILFAAVALNVYDAAITLNGIVLAMFAFAIGIYNYLPGTRGSNIPDSLRSAATIIAMIAAITFASSAQGLAALWIHLSLLVLVIALRQWAKRRWHKVDWMVCKPIKTIR